jgi:hypothetical protein
VNAAPTTGYPRAARRPGCLGTFLLVLVLWSFSVVALTAYLAARSLIHRQVRWAWWSFFLAALGGLAIEVAIFEATGDGLADLLRLHVHPWWRCCTATASNHCSPGRCWWSPARHPSAFLPV